MGFVELLGGRLMFGWLWKNKPTQISAENGSRKKAEEITRIVNTYVALLQAHPHHVLDASWLPADKQTMIEIFKLSWLAGNDKMRKDAETWWSLLSHFQPGVGPVPIDVEISKDNPTVKEWRERAARVKKWLEIAIAEDEKYGREIALFRQQNQKFELPRKPTQAKPKEAPIDPFSDEMMAGFKNNFGKFYGTDHLAKMGWNSYLSSMFRTNKPFDDSVEICWHAGAMASFKTVFETTSSTSDPRRAGELMGSSVDRLWKEYCSINIQP
jgi:hypothetical protein